MGTKKLPKECPRCGYKVVKSGGRVPRGSARRNSEWAVMMWWVKQKHGDDIKANPDIKNKLQKVMELAKAYWDRHGVTDKIAELWEAAHPPQKVDRGAKRGGGLLGN